MKKLLLVLALLLIPRLMFSKTTTYNTSFNSPKKFTINYSIDRDTFDQYVDINSEGVFFDKSSFDSYYEDKVQDGSISENQYTNLMDQSEYLSNVADTITELVQSNEGTINENGDFIPNNPGKSPVASKDEIERTKEEVKRKAKQANIFYPEETNYLEFVSTPFVIDSSFNIFSGWHVTFGPLGSVVMGLIGIIVNMFNWFDPRNYTLSNYDILTAGLTDSNLTSAEATGKLIVGNPIFQDVVNQLESQFKDAGIILTVMTSVLFIVMGVMTLMDATGLGWIKQLILLIAGLYLPSLITGLEMMIGGITEMDTTQAHIWYFWSNYQVIRRRVI